MLTKRNSKSKHRSMGSTPWHKHLGVEHGLRASRQAPLQVDGSAAEKPPAPAVPNGSVCARHLTKCVGPHSRGCGLHSL
jgi:hypothetical protein